MSTLPVSLDIPNPKDFERFVPRETHLNWGKSRYVDPWVSLVKSLRESPGHSAVVVQAPEDKVKIKAAPLVATSKEKTNFEGAMEGLSTTPEQQANNSSTEIIPPDNVEVRVPPEAPNTVRRRGKETLKTLERKFTAAQHLVNVDEKKAEESPSRDNKNALVKSQRKMKAAEIRLQSRRKAEALEIPAKSPKVKNTPAPKGKLNFQTDTELGSGYETAATNFTKGKVGAIAQTIEKKLSAQEIVEARNRKFAVLRRKK